MPTRPAVFSRILIPLDGSEAAERIIPYAAFLAGCSGAELMLFYSLAPMHAARSGRGQINYPDMLHDRGQSLVSAYLAEIAGRLKETGIRVRTGIVTGDPAEMIVSRANVGGFDLIAMTTTARSPWLRRVRPGTLAGVWSHTSTPLLLVNDACPHDSFHDPAEIRHVLVPLNGTTTAERALPYARRIARIAKMPVILLAVARDLRGFQRAAELAAHIGKIPTIDPEASIRRYLAEKGEEFRAHSMDVETEIDYGDPASSVARRQAGAERHLLVMSSQLRAGLRAFHGSVADRIIRMCAGPLICVPAGGGQPPQGGEDEADEDAESGASPVAAR